MNKFVTVLGVAAVATLAGCKDPNYKPFSTYDSQNDVKVVEPSPTPVPPPVPVKPTCKCPPGTKHASPCVCGAPDCKCIVEVKPLPPPPAPVPESTTYIVQRGDYLAKISKKYNISIAAIKKLNGLKDDKVRLGQKLKLPGKVDVGVQQVPVMATPAKKPGKSAVDYTGATKEYVVKSGDTLGAIAYGNGLNIRQLKKLNGLTGDSLKVGQKLKVPAAGQAPAAPAKKADPVSVAKKATEKPVAVEPTVEPVVPVVGPETTTPAPAPTVEPAEASTAAPAASADSSTQTYVVQEGDDMTGVSIRYGVSSAAIRELNNLPEDAQLTVGQTIKLPAEAQQ